jgi:polyisoprenoid-binding protein YceI
MYMNINILLKQTLAIIMAVGWLSLAHANPVENDLCSPFRDGKVDTSLLSTMLDAARDGYLYRIESSTSQVGFCVSSKFSRVKGHFHEFSGGIALPPTGATANSDQAMIVINTGSLDTDGSLVEAMIKSERFFDVEKYPEILFVSRDFEWTGKDTATITGDLTVHGVTRPVVFAVTLTHVNDAAGNITHRMIVKATTTITRSQFGMDNMSKVVSDSVDLCMSVEVVRYTA